MSQDPKKTLGLAGAVAMVGLNITVVAFFVLWKIADSTAVGRMESESNMDPGQMLPNSELMWLAAHGSVLMVVVLDVLAVAWLAKMTGVSQRSASRNISGSSQARVKHRPEITRLQQGPRDIVREVPEPPTPTHEDAPTGH